MNVLLQRMEGERSYAEMFRRYKTRVFIAMSAQALAQLNGINVISYYAPYVFESAGWIGHDAVMMTGINGITYFLSTIPPWYIVDRWGRRVILLSGAVLMAASLSMVSYFLFLDVSYTPTMVVIFVMIYNAAFGYSWGPIPWLYPPEILPLSIRSKGASLSTASNWAFNWLVGLMTPILQEWIHWRLYLVHAFFCVISFVVGKFCSLTAPFFFFLCPPRAGRRDTSNLSPRGSIVNTFFRSVLRVPRDLRRTARGHGLAVRGREHGGRDAGSAVGIGGVPGGLAGTIARSPGTGRQRRGGRRGGHPTSRHRPARRQHGRRPPAVPVLTTAGAVPLR